MGVPTQSIGRLAWVAMAIAAAGCNSMPDMSEVVKDRSVEYKSSRSLPPLEVPPDLSSATIEDSMAVPDLGGSATFSQYAEKDDDAPASGATGVLVMPEGVRVERDGDKRWLVLDGSPSQYWSRVREFWIENGLVLKVENPAIGIMETDWAENRADIPQDFLRSAIGKVFDSAYSSATRDKYRVRFERGSKPESTELYITHRGAEEVVKGETTVWQPRPSDPELEAEMLHRLIVFLGVKEDSARRMIASQDQRVSRARMVREGSGDAYLALDEGFSRAWRRTGLALDRVGFTVEDRDRSRGLYFVRYVDPLAADKDDVSLLSKLKFWGSEETDRQIEYLISLSGEGDITRVSILDKEGNPDRGDTAGRILNLLHEQLK